MKVSSVMLRVSLLMMLGSVTGTAAASDELVDYAHILLYHHVGKDTPASTSVTPAQFESQLLWMMEHDYRVIPLGEIVAALAAKRALAPRSVAISFDDAYVSIYQNAWPLLRRHGLPFTVFVATDAVDQGYATIMNWSQLRELEQAGATIANHGSSHAHLLQRHSGESEAAWQQGVMTDIRTGQQRLDAELQSPALWFAYPYGEFDTGLEEMLAEQGTIAFGQQSGPLGWNSDLQALARIPVASAYADLSRLAEKLRSRPLPVEVMAPRSRIVADKSAAPTLQLRVPPGPYRREAMVCYVAGQEPARISWQGDVAAVVAQRALPLGRSKYNCTAPAVGEPGVYYWYSHLWLQPREDGTWPD